MKYLKTRFMRFAVGVTVALSLFAVVGVAQASSLTSVQISAIVGLMQAFGADQSVINNVTASLNGQATPGQGPTGAGNSCFGLSHNLYVGTTDATTGGEVSKLQAMLGVSATGYFGPLTKQAVMNWQSARGISPIGIVGPATRAAMGCGGSTVPVQTGINFSATPTSGAAPLTVTMSWNDLHAGGYIDFGDFSQSNCTSNSCAASSITHTYATPGTYTVRFYRYATSASDSDSVVGTAHVTVTSGSTSATPTATIDSRTITPTNRTITGTATGISKVTVGLYTHTPAKFHEWTMVDAADLQQDIAVVNGRWSFTVQGGNDLVNGTTLRVIHDGPTPGTGDAAVLASGVLTISPY